MRTLKPFAMATGLVAALAGMQAVQPKALIFLLNWLGIDPQPAVDAVIAAITSGSIDFLQIVLLL